MFLDPEKPIEKHRINLPHWQQDDAWIFATWRLADSLPKKVVDRLAKQREEWLSQHPKPWNEDEQRDYNRRFTLRFEELLDEAHGSCVLRRPEIHRLVGDAITHFETERYRIDCYVVMPNHVHVLFLALAGHRMEDILHSWKSFTSMKINKVLGRSGPLWQREYWDRLIRSQKHFDWVRRYISDNPKHLPPGSFHYGEGASSPLNDPE